MDKPDFEVIKELMYDNVDALFCAHQALMEPQSTWTVNEAAAPRNAVGLVVTNLRRLLEQLEDWYTEQPKAQAETVEN